jgi:6-phosphogluconate dehydrogenase
LQRSRRPIRAPQLSSRLTRRRYLSGGEVGAKNATLSIMVGGPEAAFNRVKPLLDAMGKNITLVGNNGDGQTAKVAPGGVGNDALAIGTRALRI